VEARHSHTGINFKRFDSSACFSIPLLLVVVTWLLSGNPLRMKKIYPASYEALKVAVGARKTARLPGTASACNAHLGFMLINLSC